MTQKSKKYEPFVIWINIHVLFTNPIGMWFFKELISQSIFRKSRQRERVREKWMCITREWKGTEIAESVR